MKEAKLEGGTIRILSKNLQPVIKTKKRWKNKRFPTENIEQIFERYKCQNSENELIDPNNTKFLKGWLTPDKKPRGGRIITLPDGQKLDKAFSLFSPNLKIHDDKSHDHWDVIYQNPNGKFAYLYTLEKKNQFKIKKYRKVNEFEKRLPELEKNLDEAIKKGELMALAIYTLLKTKMRIGSEIYFKNHNHKGLSTLQKRDVRISNPKVKFSFIAKDGVPQKIEKEFPEEYILELEKLIKKIKLNEFIFTKNNKPLKDTEFEKAFEEYCGARFYPHIVRSHFATKTTKEFLKKNPKPNKRQIKELYESIAKELGHKKFSKKHNDWETSYAITIRHYIDPRLIEKIEKSLKK